MLRTLQAHGLNAGITRYARDRRRPSQRCFDGSRHPETARPPILPIRFGNLCRLVPSNSQRQELGHANLSSCSNRIGRA
jgi:hypothetical protein